MAKNQYGTCEACGGGYRRTRARKRFCSRSCAFRPKPREKYTDNRVIDGRLEWARRLAEGDGRLRYVTHNGSLKQNRNWSQNCIVMGARDWAVIVDGVWKHKRYSVMANFRRIGNDTVSA